MDALGWALGDRPDEEQIRGAADEAAVEAAFGRAASRQPWDGQAFLPGCA
jgi:DNA repair ATPase RecN